MENSSSNGLFSPQLSVKIAGKKEPDEELINLD